MNTTIELTSEERVHLAEHLDHELWKLREEIQRTDSLLYKQMLHKKESLLEMLSSKVGVPQEEPALLK
jgi:hypothetical protein